MFQVHKKPDKHTSKALRDRGSKKTEENFQPKFKAANIFQHAAKNWKNWSTSQKIAYTIIILLAISSSITMVYMFLTHGFPAFYEMLDNYFNQMGQKTNIPYSTKTEVGFFKQDAEPAPIDQCRALSSYLEDISISWEASAQKELANKGHSLDNFASLIKEIMPEVMQEELMQKAFGIPTDSTLSKQTSTNRNVKIKVATSTYLGKDRARYEFESKTLYLRYEQKPEKSTLKRLMRNEANHLLNQRTNEIIFKRNSLQLPADSRQGHPFFNNKGVHDPKLLRDFSDAIKAGDDRIKSFQELFEKHESGIKMTAEEAVSLEKDLKVMATYEPLIHYITLHKMQLEQALATGSFKKTKLPGIKYIGSKKINPQLPSDFYITDVITHSEGLVELKGRFSKNNNTSEKAKAFIADHTETRKIYFKKDYYANKPDSVIAQRLSDIDESPETRKHFYSEVCKLSTERHFENPKDKDYCGSFNP